LKKSETLKAHFERGLNVLVERWTESVFARAYIAADLGLATAAESLEPQLFGDVVTFRHWHNELCEARDRLASPAEEVRFFDSELWEMLQREEGRQVDQVDTAESITVACWRGGRGDHFLRTSVGGRAAESYRIDGGVDVDTD
jgi:hypothetical protein